LKVGCLAISSAVSFSGGGTSGIWLWWFERGFPLAWNETMIEKIALPCWIAVTRRVE